MPLVADIEMPPPIHSVPVDVAQRFLPWLFLACAIVLFAAASLHWRRTGHRYLLALASASLLVTVHAIASLIFRMAPPVTILPSGAIRIDTRLITLAEWSLVAGVVVGLVGGIEAIRWALRSGRHAEPSAANRDAEPPHVPEPPIAPE